MSLQMSLAHLHQQHYERAYRFATYKSKLNREPGSALAIGKLFRRSRESRMHVRTIYFVRLNYFVEIFVRFLGILLFYFITFLFLAWEYVAIGLPAKSLPHPHDEFVTLLLQDHWQPLPQHLAVIGMKRIVKSED